MTEKRWFTIIHIIIWLLIVPPGMAYLLANHMPEELNFTYLFFFITFGILTILFPIKLNGEKVALVMWVTLPVFLMYGVAVEALVMQLTVAATLINRKRHVRNSHRFFFNSTMMFILSVVSAVAFHVVGGEVGSKSFWSLLICAGVYRMIHTATNLSILTGYMQLQGHRKLAAKDIAYEFANSVLIIPLALTFYFILNIIGTPTFLLLGFPFFATITIIRLYGRSEKVNDYIKRAGEIGSDLSVLTNERTVTEQFVKSSSELFYADVVLLFKNYDSWLELDMVYEKKGFGDMDYGIIHPGEGIAGMVLESNEPVIYSKRKEWMQFATASAPEEIESILCIPLSHDNKVNGVLFLGSNRKSAFKDYHLKILDMLGSYYIVSLEKAHFMQEALLKSEKCALTKLYNYRYLEERLHFEFNRMQKGDIENLSVVILDIDHFKKVNDTYGHQSGNDILYGLARILERELPDYGTVGRYGGEEFVYLLPEFRKDEAFQFASRLRLLIREYAFTVIPDLSVDKQPMDVFITLSVGVANAPEDTDEPMTLLRNADRALYIGAKQAGRDRVAEYVK